VNGRESTRWGRLYALVVLELALVIALCAVLSRVRL
jgi:hypothetical protein